MLKASLARKFLDPKVMQGRKALQVLKGLRESKERGAPKAFRGLPVRKEILVHKEFKGKKVLRVRRVIKGILVRLAYKEILVQLDLKVVLDRRGRLAQEVTLVRSVPRVSKVRLVLRDQ